MELVINWASSDDNPASDYLAEMLAQNPALEELGMTINQTVMPYSELMVEHYCNFDEDLYNMYNMATNFSSPVYDPKLSYEVGGSENYSHTANEELALLAEELTKCEPEEKDKFLNNFAAFQKEWNDYLPALPLYSNQYFDFFSNRVEKYEGITGYVGEHNILLYAKIKGF